MSSFRLNFDSAVILFKKKDFIGAKKLLLNLLHDYPEDKKILNILGIISSFNKNYDDSENLFKKILKIEPNDRDALYNLAKCLSDQNKDLEAIDYHKKIIKLYPNYLDGWLNYGQSCQKLGRYKDALSSYNYIIKKNSKLSSPYINIGLIFYKSKKYLEAINYYNKAILINDKIPEAYLNKGLLLFEIKDYKNAIKNFDIALNINPFYSEALNNKALVLCELKQYKKAIDLFQKAIKLDNYNSAIIASLFLAKLRICDWTEFYTHLDDCCNLIKNSNIPILPFAFLSMIDSPEMQLKNSVLYINKKNNKYLKSNFIFNDKNHKKIKIGYFSSDYYNHPVGQLISKIIKNHNTSDFETYGFSFNSNIEDDLTSEIKESFNFYYDLTNKTDDEIIDFILKLQIDIAIDLNGFTSNNRSEIFCRRVAPVQINYLGFTSTMGSKMYDYVIADKVVINDKNNKFFTEKIIFMPNTYLPNHSDRNISKNKFKKTDFNLPINSFVYCNFNNSYKLNPKIFDLWLDILRDTENSILWLSEDNKDVIENLHNYAIKKDIDHKRLIFAKKFPNIEDHFARYELADVFLDTFPFNGHVTSSDALWCGLPVLTCKGSSFTSRVSASLLNSLNLTYLVCSNFDEYRDKAIELFSNNDKLLKLKEKLNINKIKTETFNSAIYTKNLEKAFLEVFKIYLNGHDNRDIYL